MSQLVYEMNKDQRSKTFMIYEVREIKSFNDVINSDVRTSLLSSVLFCHNTPLYNYICMRINLIEAHK